MRCKGGTIARRFLWKYLGEQSDRQKREPARNGPTSELARRGAPRHGGAVYSTSGGEKERPIHTIKGEEHGGMKGEIRMPAFIPKGVRGKRRTKPLP